MRGKKIRLSCVMYIMILTLMIAGITACSGAASGAAGKNADPGTSGKQSLESSSQIRSETRKKKAEVIKGEKGEEMPWYIRVNRTTNCVTIYKLDEKKDQYQPVQAMICSVGRDGNTPCGDFKLQERYEWRELFGNVYGQYAVRVVKSILFHSVPYLQPSQDTLKTEEFDKLGTSASDGCIRLQVKDSKWIFDNCLEGTVVTIFDGSEEDDPLDRPEAEKLTGSAYPLWDPTDPIAVNPWKGGDGDIYAYKESVEASEQASIQASLAERWKEAQSRYQAGSSANAYQETSRTFQSRESTHGSTERETTRRQTTQAVTRKETTQKETTKKETTKRETTQKETTKKETTKKETTKKETTQKETVKETGDSSSGKHAAGTNGQEYAAQESGATSRE